jgi:hypothetical protein
MRALGLCSLVTVVTIVCTACAHKNAAPPPQAQAPPLQTGKGTIEQAQTTQPQEKSDTPLASPLPAPSAQSVPIPPPPPKKVHHPKHPATKPADTTQTAAASSGSPSAPSSSSAQASAQAPAQPAPTPVATSPIGQLTTGDSAIGERTKHETADLIGETEQGLNAIKRALSNEEKTTVAQIRTFLKQAQQALDNGDTEGAHGLATKAKLLLDELTKP